MLGSPRKCPDPAKRERGAEKAVTAADGDGAEAGARAILDALRRLVRGLHLHSRRCEERLGLSAAQLFALRGLRDGMSLRELAGATLTDLSSVSVVAERLREKGLLERRRSASDRRRAELSLTPAGRTLLRRAPDTPQERLVRALEGLPAARRRALTRDLRHVTRSAGMLDDPARLFFEDEP